MEILLAIITGGVAAAIIDNVFKIITNKINRDAAKEDKQEDETDDIKCGLRILLYSKIKSLGKEYITRGYIHTEELEDIIGMHEVYHDKLGGNGFLDDLMKQVHNLPIKE